MGNFNVEDAVKNQEKEQNYGSQEAMAKAKENLAEQRLRKETAEIERRLSQSKSSTEDAVKALRMARVREKAQKAYLESLNKADADFEATGNYKAYDEASRKACEERDKAIADGKHEIYGEDHWRY